MGMKMKCLDSLKFTQLNFIVSSFNLLVLRTEDELVANDLNFIKCHLPKTCYATTPTLVTLLHPSSYKTVTLLHPKIGISNRQITLFLSVRESNAMIYNGKTCKR